MIMTSVSWGLISYAIESEDEKSIYDFAKDLSQLIQENNDIVNDGQYVENVVQWSKCS